MTAYRLVAVAVLVRVELVSDRAFFRGGFVRLFCTSG
jgi:hypothetical protein